MDAFLDTLAGNPLLAAGAIALVLMVVFAIVKKLMKLALVTGVVFVALIGWSYFTGNEPGDAVRVFKTDQHPVQDPPGASTQ